MNAIGPERLDGILEQACRIYDLGMAVIGSAKLTYRELAERAAGLRDKLQDNRINPNEPVIVVVGNAAHNLAGLYGIWKAGGVAVPLHHQAASATISDLIARTGVRFVVTGNYSLIIQSDTTSQVDGPVLKLERPEPATRDILRDAALVIFTSGSTGRPKGVVLSHRAFANKLKAIQSVIPFKENTETLLPLQITFSYGQAMALLTLATGGTVRMMPKFDPVLSLVEMLKHPVARVAAVPTMMRAWAAVGADDSAGQIFEELRELRRPELIIAGGEPLSSALGAHFRKLLPATGIAHAFGLTETSTFDFILPPDKYDFYPETIGWPIPGVSFLIACEGGGRARFPSGELRINTSHIMNGYLDEPEMTQASFDGDYFRTGDLAELTESGAVRFVGRQKEIIVRGGNKISPLEVERVFTEHPSVAAALATGIPDDLMGERIHILIVPRQGAMPTEQELRDWGRTRIDKFKMPDRFHFGSDLPMGRTGKADRRELCRRITDGTL
jgi:long-chain acyl-CoA synthetase